MTMKAIKLTMLAALAALAGLPAAAQQLQTNNYSFSVNQAIPEGSPFGLTESNTLAVVSAGTISSVTVSLDISGGFNGGLYAYLVGPNGGFAVLLNRPGVDSGNSVGYSDAGMNITLSDSAANGIHFYQSSSYSLNGSGQLTGTWQTDGENISPGSAPSDFPTTQSAMLSSLDGTDPNGTWTLFIADLSSGAQSTFVSFDYTIISDVPEPSSMALVGVGLAGVWLVSRRNRLAAGK